VLPNTNTHSYKNKLHITKCLLLPLNNPSRSARTFPRRRCLPRDNRRKSCALWESRPRRSRSVTCPRVTWKVCVFFVFKTDGEEKDALEFAFLFIDARSRAVSSLSRANSPFIVIFNFLFSWLSLDDEKGKRKGYIRNPKIRSLFSPVTITPHPRENARKRKLTVWVFVYVGCFCTRRRVKRTDERIKINSMPARLDHFFSSSSLFWWGVKKTTKSSLGRWLLFFGWVTIESKMRRRKRFSLWKKLLY